MFECVTLNIHSNKKTPYTVRKLIAGVYGFPFQNADAALHFHQEVRYGTQNLQKGMRTFLLPKGTLHVLKERKKHAVTEWIFPSLLTPEQPTAPNSAYQRLKVILQNAGLPDIRFHDLRHPYVKLKTKKFRDFWSKKPTFRITLSSAFVFAPSETNRARENLLLHSLFQFDCP